jgi:uncharacterized membrane protein
LTGSEERLSDGLRRVSGSGDAKLIGVLVAATLALGAIGILAVPFISTQDRSGDVIESYTATLHRDGTLLETYVYTLKSSDTRMLFRYWEESLDYDVMGRGNDNIALMNVVAPEGSVAYVKNQNGHVTILPSAQSNPYDVSTISELAFLNEAGCYNPYYFPPGSYTVSYTFKINFWIDTDFTHDHLNLMLANEHLPYKNVMIVLEDAGYITEVFQHPPSLKVARVGEDIVISGSSAENEMLEVEMLMITGAHGFMTDYPPDSDLEGLTEQANSLYSTQYWSAYYLGYIAKAAVLLTPLIFLGLWMRYGRDEDAIVPPYLSTVPNPDRKPWVVNHVFNKGVNDMDENGFYATLLDLDRRKKIRIEPREGGMKIFVLDKDVGDAYEQRTMEFLGKLATLDATSPDNPQAVFDTDTLKELAAKIGAGSTDAKVAEAQKDILALTNYKSQSWANARAAQVFSCVFLLFLTLMAFYANEPFAIMIAVGMSGLIFFGGFNDWRRRKAAHTEWIKVSEAFFVEGRRRVLPLAVLGALLLAASIIIFLLAPVVSYLLWTPVILGVVALVQVAAAYFSPPTIFGRWKDGMFKEKLEWDAFRAHLSDYSQLSRYSTEDLNMWGTWLVYGTALGVGDKVAKAMKEFNIKLDAAIVATSAHTHFHPMIAASSMVSSGVGGGGHKGGGGHGGGGHGGGGGRGRGGAGRR